MTIKELAALAGVSPAAVSRYFNGGSLSNEKRDVIRAAIEQTGYRPDAAAQALRTRTTDLVGLIVPKLDSESVSRLVAGAEEVLAAEGYLSLVAVSRNSPEKELSFLSLMQKYAVAGVIIMATVATPRLEEFVRDLPIPVVVTGQNLHRAFCVYHDDFGAAQELTRLVLARGRTRSVYLGVTEQDAAAGLARREGVQAALREAGRDPELPRTVCSFDIDGGRCGMTELLERVPELDAVICATDRIAFGAMEILKQAGRVIGQDVSVVGIGDSWASRLISPNLTTAHFYYKTCGETAARQLVELMRNKDTVRPAQQIMLSYEIKERESV